MPEINLLQRYPRLRRNIPARAHAKTEAHVRIARTYGPEYFDGAREYGYGGYRNDGRWRAVADDLIAHWRLKRGDRVLDVGCAKGFLVKDLMAACLGLEAFGLDISEYALRHCEPEVVGRLHLGNATRLPFPDRSFTAVISINTLHNLDHDDCIAALREIERLAPGRGYVQVDSYHTPAERALFLDWVLTAQTHGYPEDWRRLFDQAGYTGDYYWTVVE